uniref:Protein kinase domain-containing protein n=1 Tax=Panagrolaimus sp. PS1159 TaxID=55785 RepID=A0AC35GE35_9BILA
MIIIICVVGVVVLLIILCACIFICRRRFLLRKKVKDIIQISNHQNSKDQETDEWELTWDDLLTKNQQLGTGAYGQVLKGVLLEKSRHIVRDKYNEVAIKMPQRYADEGIKKRFLNEIQLTKLITGHNNIVKMLGCITVGERICLVLEFCSYCDLLHLKKSLQFNLLQNANQTIKEFLIFAWQISHGMQFLTSEGIIHRDLAARNILIDCDKTAKISDFGLCVQINDKHENSPSKNILILKTGKLPIKWLAIESLKNAEFSFKSDVWSFGMVLYEMLSFGEIPFCNVQPEMLIEHLEEGKRPNKPDLCSNEIYSIMQQCWDETPSSRPSFDELITTFKVFLEHATKGYGYLDLLKSQTPSTD